MTKSLILTLLALIVLITGFGKAVSAVKETKEAKARIESKQKRLAQLRELAAGTSATSAPATLRPEDLERADLDAPAPFRKLVSVYLEDHVTTVRDQPAKPLSAEHPGWQVRRSELQVTDLPWTALARFLQKTGSQPHPWRLAKYDLTPNENGGSGSLVFETVVRAGAK